MGKVTTVHVYTSRDGFRFRAKSRNGKIIAVSEAYTRPSDAKRGARRAFPQASIVVKG